MEQKPPQRASYKDAGGLENPSGDNKKSKLSNGNLMNYIVMVIIAVAVCIVMSNFIGVTAKIYNKNNTSIDGEINSINALIKTMQTSISGMPATVNTAVASAVSSLNTQISTFTSSVDTLQSEEKADGTNITNDEATITTLKNSLTAMQTSIDSLKTAMGNVNDSALQASLTTLQGTVASMQTELNTDEATIKSQGTMIASLQTGGTTTTTTTTPVNTGVYVLATPPQLTLTGSGTPKIFTNTFNLTVYNTTNKTISGGVIGFTLTLQAGLPSGETVATDLPITALVINPNQLTLRSGVTFSGNQATFTGDYSGYLVTNSSQTLTITVSFTSAYSGTTMGMAVSSPTITGYTTY